MCLVYSRTIKSIFPFALVLSVSHLLSQPSPGISTHLLVLPICSCVLPTLLTGAFHMPIGIILDLIAVNFNMCVTLCLILLLIYLFKLFFLAPLQALSFFLSRKISEAIIILGL